MEFTRGIHEPDGRPCRRLTLEQWLPLPPDALWPFYADAYNLEQLTPPFLKFRVLTPAPIEMGEGTLIDYRLRLHGLPIRWRTVISLWAPDASPPRFIDCAVRSPYRLWHHDHIFEPHDGGTRCRDIVDYRVPFDWLAHRFVQRELRTIFAFRQQVLADRFGSRPAATAPK